MQDRRCSWRPTWCPKRLTFIGPRASVEYLVEDGDDLHMAAECPPRMYVRPMRPAEFNLNV